MTIDGSWQVYLWVNGSAYKPTGFTLHFMEITTGGNTLWDSGTVSPTVTSSIGSYIDVPVYKYNLSAPLTHSFGAGSTIFVGIQVNSGSSADTRIWYDSELYPSKVILPAKDYARPARVRTYAYGNSETNLFHYNWTEDQRIVTIRANLTAPFGGYDIQRVDMTILDPAGNAVVDDVSMKSVSDGQWETVCSHLYETDYTYSATAQRGNYTVIVTVVDNNGYYHNLQTETYEPFIFFQSMIAGLDLNITSIPSILLVSALLSQVISNVPVVALYLPVLTSAGASTPGLMALAAGSTIAGNLFILGTASNVIIIQNAEKKFGETLTFVDFAKIGIPLTAMNLLVYWLFLSFGL